MVLWQMMMQSMSRKFFLHFGVSSKFWEYKTVRTCSSGLIGGAMTRPESAFDSDNKFCFFHPFLLIFYKRFWNTYCFIRRKTSCIWKSKFEAFLRKFQKRQAWWKAFDITKLCGKLISKSCFQPCWDNWGMYLHMLTEGMIFICEIEYSNAVFPTENRSKYF